MIEIDRYSVQSALDAAASKYVNGLAPLPPLAWTFDRDASGHYELSGQVSDMDYDDPAAVAQLWVAALGLGDAVEMYSTRQHCGDDGGMQIRVWYVTDRDAFER